MKMFAKSIVGRSCSRLAGLALVPLMLLLVTQYSQAVEGISEAALQQISALQAEKASRTPAQIKMDSQLVYALKQSRGQPFASGVTNLVLGVTVAEDGTVLVDIDAQVGPALLDAIQQAGGTLRFSSQRFSSIRATMPLAQLENIAGRADVTFIRPAVQALTSTGSVDSEGDVTHRADRARALFGVNGTGVKVGVLSDSVDFLAQAQSTGDLPPNVTVLPGQAGVGAGEGTAMLEIVYDLAPGAQLFFAAGLNGEAQFAQNILDLRSAGCDIIVDDIGYFDESPFQDSTVALAVDQVTADGALYFSSAGNSGNLTHGTSGTWEGDFADGGAAGPPVSGKQGTLHSFGATAYDTCTGNGFATVLHWSDPLGRSTNDYDLYVLDAAGTTVISSSTTVQNGSQNPFEIVPPPRTGQRVVVVKASGDPRFLHIDTIRGQLGIGTTGNITGHAATARAFGVAAVDVHTAFPNPFSGGAANPVESFSTDGPRRVFYNPDGSPITPGNFLASGGFLRPKPDIAAADGVATTLPPNSGLNPFYGTSAAAPHAAAIAALVKSYNPTLSYPEVRSILTGSALDIEVLGIDVNAGAGIVMAEQALRIAPIGVNLVVVTNYLTGGNGNGIIDFDECNNLDIVLQNLGSSGATNVQATLSTTNANVIIAQRTSRYPNLPPGAAATNLIPFKISTSPNFVCGTAVNLNFVVKTDEGSRTNVLQFISGTNGIPIRFDGVAGVNIPDNDPIGTNSTVFVTNVIAPIGKVAVSLFINHTFDSDLTLQLIGPDGTTATLSANNGSSGNNYGISCSDVNRTIFDDDAQDPITGGNPPFIGTFRPQSPLSVFASKTGTNVNGVWKLHVVDGAALDIGTINCWSLLLSPAICSDGGGQCPGADLAIGMIALPEPVFVGTNLTYTITATNFGPNNAKNTIISQVLPPGVVFVSASVSQGNISYSGGTVTANLGNLNVGATAVASVTVTPTSAGLLSSTATISSSEPEIDPSNNSVTVFSHVNPPFADLAIGLFDAPDPVAVNSTLTYTLSVTNRGPSTASGIVVTNIMPVSAGITGATASQGFATINGNVVVCNFGSLPNGGRATASITVVPTLEGAITASSSATANQTDPVLENNFASATTTVAPSADLALGLVDTPDPVVTLSNLTYTINVTNLGPSTATAVAVSQTLPAGVSVVSSNSTRGTITIGGGTVNCDLGTMTNGARATITVVVRPGAAGTLSSSATVSAAQGDPRSANNTASANTTVSPPIVTIVPAGATLLAESFSPTNGTIEPGETVTVQLRLQNIGNVSNTNLVATLLATNGVTSPSGSMTYGPLKPIGLAGFAIAENFTFTASGTNGGTVTAVLQLQDGPNTLSPVTFTFTLPSQYSFSNTAAIIIPDSGAGTPYPSVIHVSGVPGLVGKATVTLSNVNHTFPHDINALLVGPGGSGSLFMSHGAEGALNNVTLTFDDAAAAPLPASGQLISGSYQPAAYSPNPSFPAPAPSASFAAPLSAFNGGSANGDWSLYILDDSDGDHGAISNGWSLSLTSLTPVNQVADLVASVSSLPNPVLVGNTLTNVFTITDAGPNDSTGAAFTNRLPANVSLVSATSSQGGISINGNLLAASLGALRAGSNATVTLIVTPTAAGSLSLTGAVSGAEIDLNLGNNSAIATVNANLPLADISVTSIGAPNPATVGSNLTYSIIVSNSGPNNALNVLLSNTVPAGATYVSSSVSQGSISNLNGTVIANIGMLTSGAAATLNIVLLPTSAGALTNTSRVSTLSSDSSLANNSVTVVSTVANPAPQIVPAGATMVSESFHPPDVSIEPGETVTLTMRLANTGAADTANLVATLVASGGVTSPSAAQSYGAIAHGGAPVGRNFTFTADPGATGSIIATLQLQDGANNLGTAVFTFTLPASATYSNTSSILIPDHGPANPYPSTITVSGQTGVVSKVTVALNSITHAFPDDLDVLLVGPAGQKVMLMSDAGGGHPVTNLNLSFDDSATAKLPDSSQLFSGTYLPTDYEPGDAFPPPVPSGAVASVLAAFDGASPNGTWSLFVVDDSVGDGGVVSGGWSLSITTVSPLTPPANLAVTISATPEPVFVGSAVTYSINVTNLGPSPATSVVLVDAVPSGFTVLSTNVSQGSSLIAGTTLTFNLGSINSGAGAIATVRLSPSIAGTYSNVVTVTANEADLDLSNNSAISVTTALSPLAPHLTIQPTGIQFDVSITAQPGQVYVLQASTDLVSWLPLATNTAPSNGTIKITTTNAQSFTRRFYRAVRIP